METKSWSLPDGTRVQQTCHTISRCRRYNFPVVIDATDIIEVRCNVEVHETHDPEHQNLGFEMTDDYFEDDSSGDFDDVRSNGDPQCFQGSGDCEELLFSKVKKDRDSKYSFNRIAGWHAQQRPEFSVGYCTKMTSKNVFLDMK